ncbi:MAG: bifunctional hydroxymethylpyrimidine kinase/phosphomethylpyrimidine kinase [Rhizobiales bacterium]|nr:bifunctional hydroxymethylpyrimidine kinase/phosphomethylpyrimidine kinase [Hyphomicrobiales bacterium]
MTTPIALTIAGSDPSGGAGIQADLKTFAAHGVYGASVIVALTAQNTRGVTAIHEVPGAFVEAQIDAVLDDLQVTAGKIGMLATSEIILAVARALDRSRAFPLVVDPVMVATSGDVLLQPEAEAALREFILPRALLLTPNMPEAARLLGTSIADGDDELQRQAEALLALGPQAVLVKGGHGGGGEAVDVFFDGGAPVFLRAPRIPTRNTHGTGCTLSAAIAARLATGMRLADAVRAAKSYVSAAIRAGSMLRIGHGNGPLDHAAAGRTL